MSVQRLWVIWGQCCPRVAAAPACPTAQSRNLVPIWLEIPVIVNCQNYTSQMCCFRASLSSGLLSKLLLCSLTDCGYWAAAFLFRYFPAPRFGFRSRPQTERRQPHYDEVATCNEVRSATCLTQTRCETTPDRVWQLRSLMIGEGRRSIVSICFKLRKMNILATTYVGAKPSRH